MNNDKENSAGPPAIFSEKDARKVLLKTVFCHDLTTWPLAIGALGTLAACLINPLFGIAAVGGFSISLASVTVNYFFRDQTIIERYRTEIFEQNKKSKEKVLSSLQAELKKFRTNREIGIHAKQGADQFERAPEKLEHLKEMIEEKLSLSDITRDRYVKTAQEVYFSILDNLGDVVALLKSIITIDIGYIESRQAELGKVKKPSQADKEELVTLTERENLRASHIQKVEELLTKNEEAMTKMDKTAAALVEVKTIDDRSKLETDLAVQALEELAKRASNYSVQR